LKPTFKETTLSITASVVFFSCAVTADTNSEIEKLKKRIEQLEHSSDAPVKK
jgi:hypothetical protein